MEGTDERHIVMSLLSKLSAFNSEDMMIARKSNKKRLIRADDLCSLRLITGGVISPAGDKVAYMIEIMSEDKKKYFSTLHMIDVATGQSRPFTTGEINDYSPIWSPDGSQIAFISSRNKKSGIYLIAADGGGERMLYEADGSFSNLAWMPDGKEVVFQFRWNDSHTEKDEAKKKDAPVYRHITRLYYKLDGLGFLPKDRFHIWKLDMATGKASQLTKGKYDDIDPAVSSDGKWITFLSNHSLDPDLEALRDDLFVMPSSGGNARRIPTPAGPKASPSFSPDGKRIAYLAHANPNDAWGVTNYHVWTVGVSGKPTAKDIIPRFDRQAVDLTIGDMGEGHSVLAPVWSPDGKRIYFCASDTGKTHLFYVPSGGGLPTRITKKDCHVKQATLDRKRKTVAAVISDLDHPAEIHILPAEYDGDRKAEALTICNKGLFSGFKIPKVREVWFRGYDGTDLQGWLVTPPDFSRSRKYPAILEIHGGPRVQYGFTYYFEMLYLASRGYVVLYTNPRGGAGRGETWAGTIVADWGGIDYMDCMAAGDYLEKLPYVNRKKIGVTGGSYGGYMTNWIIGHTNRFRAAVSQRSVVDLKSMFGSSDFGYALKREFALPWKDPGLIERCSPLSYAKNIRTPLLILHNEQDLRCSISQAEQMFITLKMMKKTVEFVRFPEEPHGLSRHGRPDRRVARLEWIARWFDRYLKR